MVLFPREGEAAVLFGINCFSSPGRAKLWCCLELIVSVPQGERGCGVVPQGGRSCGVVWN